MCRIRHRSDTNVSDPTPIRHRSDTNVSDPTPPDTSDTKPTQMCRIRHQSDTDPTQMCRIRHHPTHPTPIRHKCVGSDTTRHIRHQADTCVGTDTDTSDTDPTHLTPEHTTRHATDTCVGGVGQSVGMCRVLLVSRLTLYL